ncbi:GPI ethanolamine phosphate transferase 2, catalytic subunit-like isoform X2 [Styela clava]
MKFKWRLMCFYFITVLGIFVYLKGFFPVKISRVGFSSEDDIPPAPSDSDILLQLSSVDFHSPDNTPTVKSKDPLPKNFTKLVLVVINGLREDFVFASHHLHNLPFIHKLLLGGDAAGFISRAEAPTLTMPRIKALMTGSVPGYADVILSLDAAKELKEDNFIRNAFSAGRSIVFYGDDTWTRLHPGKFKRQNGVSSFFVTDYTEVDKNITQHVKTELNYPDHFDMMVLHYIGLGHIGHIAGAKSPLIDSKLKEMDFVIQQIYETLQKHDAEKNSRSLIVVTGDHGMTDKGSHGGTTHHERNTPLLFLSPKISLESDIDIPTEVQQIDLTSTLSVLFGLPIPRNSMGKLITPLIQRLSPADQLHVLEYNSHHLLTLAGKTGTLDKEQFGFANPLQLYGEGLLSHATYLQHQDIADNKFEDAKKSYVSSQKIISDELMYNIASYNYMYMGIGMVLTWLGYFAVAVSWGQIVLIHKAPTNTDEPRDAPSSPVTWGVLATLGTIVHGMSLLSSSFLEEEHQTWYFLTTTFLAILFCSVIMEIVGKKLGMAETIQKGFFSRKKSSPTRKVRGKEESMELLHRAKSDESVDSTWDFVELETNTEEEFTFDKTKKGPQNDSDIHIVGVLIASLIAHRVLRAWNRTGIQYVDLPDIGDWLNRPDNSPILGLTHLISLISIAILLEMITNGKDIWRRGVVWVGLGCVFWYRSAVMRALRGEEISNGDHAIGLLPALLSYLSVVLVLGRGIFLKSRKISGTKTMDYIISSVILLSCLLLRPHNVWALVINLYLYWSVFRLLWPIVEEDSTYSNLQIGKIVLRTTLCYWFGQMSYFSFGNSNSLASIDVSSGFVGMSHHTGTLEDSIVRCLIIFTTYIGPMTWTMLCLADSVDVTLQNSTSKQYSRPALLAVFSTFAFLRITPTAFYLILITAMRYHQFVWSVFAPKLLFETASTVIYGAMLLAASIAAKWIT